MSYWKNVQKEILGILHEVEHYYINDGLRSCMTLEHSNVLNDRRQLDR